MTNICPVCGAETDNNSTFCAACGAELTAQKPKQRKLPILDETPVYSVNAVRPAELRYTLPDEPADTAVLKTASTAADSHTRKKRRRTPAILAVITVALIGILGGFAFTQGRLAPSRHLDGNYRLTGLISGGKDYSMSVGGVSDRSGLRIAGEECTMVLGNNSEPYRFSIDQAEHTLSGGGSTIRFFVNEADGVPYITIPIHDSVLTFSVKN